MEHPATGRRPNWGLHLLSGLNLAGLVAVWGLEVLVGERHWLTTLLAYAPQHPFVAPTLGLLVWALVRRSWLPVAINTSASILFAFALMGATLPLGARSRAAGERVRIMTLNIHHASEGVDRVAALVRELQPEIACFQETNPHWVWHDPIPELQRRLPEWHIVRHGELATLSRLPILSHRVHPMPGKYRRELLESVVQVGEEQLTVLNVHFNTAARPRALLRNPRSGLTYLRNSAEVRSAQMEALLKVAERRPHHLVIAGDFNTPPRGVLYRRITTRFSDAFRMTGLGFGHTFRANMPLLRIDYLFLGEGLSSRRCFVPPERVSDHRAVVADLVF
ncbi:MAG: hypothetical protein GX785_08820 [Armatimonadetes bacterium]|jgi:vancomycin resistance protein VanJ|nr:hypothetical protein [Armatimonadota bacterium]